MPLVVDEASPGAGCGRCPPSPGIGVRDRPERVSGIVRNQCPETAGLLSRRPEPPKLPTVAWINDPNEEVTQKAS